MTARLSRLGEGIAAIASRPVWPAALSAATSLVMAVAVAHELAALEWRGLVALLPGPTWRGAGFWLAFAGFYLANVLGDWVIFRHLWGIGRAGFAALARKQVYNELIVSYLGETWFLAWANERRSRLADRGGDVFGAGIFGAVKDTAILSALAGNLAAIALLACLWPWSGATLLASSPDALIYSLPAVLGLSLALVLTRRFVFSLPPAELRFVFAAHVVRIAGRTALGALAWHLLLPEVELVWWLALATMRQLVSRLPLVANKELIFAGIAVLVLDQALVDQARIASAMALTATLLVASHMVVGIVLTGGDAARIRRIFTRPAAAIRASGEGAQPMP